MSGHGRATIGHDAAAGLLQIAPDRLGKLVSAGHVRRESPGKYVPAQVIRDYIAYLHAEPDRIERAPSQAEIAAHLDMSDRNLRDVLQAVGLDHRKSSLSEVRIAYIRKLREEAAGRAAAGDIDLATERAMLARSQREKIDMQNAERRGELAPVGLLEQALAGAASRAGKILATIKGEIRRRMPTLAASDLAAVETIVAKAMNTVASITLTEALEADADEADDIDSDPATDEATAA